jgi:hypothetical protein
MHKGNDVEALTPTHKSSCYTSICDLVGLSHTDELMFDVPVDVPILIGCASDSTSSFP